MAQAPLIMIIRHAEKPYSDYNGVDTKGNVHKHDLIVQGWQRAGALSPFFAPTDGALQNAALAQPQFLFASAPPPAGEGDPAASTDSDSKSNRPVETITPLSAKLGININTSFTKGGEKDVAKAAVACGGPVLIAWQHDAIANIASHIPGATGVPSKWPSNRFDIVYVFTLAAGGSSYTFSQVPQLLLAGDSADPIT